MAYIYTFGLCDIGRGDIYPDISIRANDDEQVINYVVDNMDKFTTLFEEIWLSCSDSYLRKNVKSYDVDDFPGKLTDIKFRNHFFLEASLVINDYLLLNNDNVSCNMLFNSSNIDISTYSVSKIKVDNIIDISMII